MDVDVPVNNTSTGDVAEDVPMTESTEATTTNNTAIDASTEPQQEQASVETPVQVPAEAPAQETPQEQQESPAQDQPQEEKSEEQDAAQEPAPQETTKEPEAKESTDETPTTPLLSAPASWQIPVGALQQAPAARPEPPVNRANLRKERFELRIKENQYDIEAWTALINDSQQTGELEAIREVYENFLKVFPTSPKHWLAYLELELKFSNFNQVEALFTRCLKTVLSVELWKFYLGYIRRINLGENGSAVTPEARVIIEKAYEYVLNNVGNDKDAGPIWADYIYFLKSAETTNTWEEQRKMDSMRRAYQKAVTVPLNNVEHLWKEYDQWENNLNRLTAKKFLGEKSSAYMTARTALREMRLFTDQINTNVVPLPPQWKQSELTQLELWKQYIEWEKGDPLQLEDANAVMERVAYTYQQAFLVLRFYPEVWYSFSRYYQEHNKPEKALSILKQGMEIMPTSLLLNFAYAEICESRKQLDEARQAFDSLVEHLDQEIERIREASQKQIDKLHHDAEEEQGALNLADDIDGELREQMRARQRNIKKEQDQIEGRTKEQVDVLARASSLVWICYMRFARRADGIKSARALFSRARKANNRTFHVFVASALMEYHNSKDASIAGKVFSLGQKIFADDPDFVCQYLDFLIQMNDDNNTRALFERTLATMPAEKSFPVWEKLLDYENKYGDLAGVHNVEKRRMEAISSSNPMESFLKRHSYLDIHNIEENELGNKAREQIAAEAATTANPEQVLPPNIVATERSTAREPVKRPLLEPVHPERYPRPDFSQWQPFKPSADANRRAPGSNIPPPPIPPPMQPAAPDVKPTPEPMMPTAPPMLNTPSPAVPMPPVPPVSAQPGWNKGPTLPEAVAYFVNNLPPAQSFNGPLIQPGELVDLLRNIIIPVPPQGAAPPPSRPMQKNTGPNMHPSNRDSRGNFSNRGRGGFKPRGNMPMRGGKGGKRRNRDDYEDDYQPHRGMGPNRPPDYDVFRERQAKRHRDDPPY